MSPLSFAGWMAFSLVLAGVGALVVLVSNLT